MSLRPTQWRSVWGACAALAPLVIGWLAAPLILRDAFPLCFFRLATGLPCPFCGLTRAVAAATHGQFLRAFILNPLWPLVVLFLVCFTGISISDAMWSRADASRSLRWLGSHWRWITMGLIAFGIARIALLRS